MQASLWPLLRWWKSSTTYYPHFPYGFVWSYFNCDLTSTLCCLEGCSYHLLQCPGPSSGSQKVWSLHIIAVSWRGVIHSARSALEKSIDLQMTPDNNQFRIPCNCQGTGAQITTSRCVLFTSPEYRIHANSPIEGMSACNLGWFLQEIKKPSLCLAVVACLHCEQWRKGNWYSIGEIKKGGEGTTIQRGVNGAAKSGWLFFFSVQF